MNTLTIVAVVLALAACQISALPRGGRGGSGGRGGPQGGGAGVFMGFGRPGQHGGFGGFGRPGHHGHHGRAPMRKSICKLNTTETDYDVPCDLPDFYECVEVTPRDDAGPSNSGRRGGRQGGGRHHGGRHGQGEISFCEQKNCTVDSDCADDFSCVDGVCNITREMKLYAVACNVTDAEGNVRKERACPGEMVCGPCPREITYGGENLTASFCRRGGRHGGRQGGPLSGFFDWVFGGSSEEEDDCPGQSGEDDGSWSWGWDSSEESQEEDMSEEEATEPPMVTEQEEQDPSVVENEIDP